MSFLDIFKIKEIKAQRDLALCEIESLNKRITQSGITTYEDAIRKINNEKASTEALISSSKTEIQTLKNQISDLLAKQNDIVTQIDQDEKKLSDLKIEIVASEEKLELQTLRHKKKLARLRELYNSIEYSISNFFNTSVSFSDCKLSVTDQQEYESLSPSVILKLHSMDIKTLRKCYRENEKQINKVLEQYSSRYTTKANKTIYALMVIALRAELQNILYNLKYDKLDKAIDDVKKVCQKYLSIATDGNQSIAGTITKFIGEIEYLFINSVKIEYNYYVKKEQAKQEQLAIREQMRQEAEERKALEAEKKKIEKEETKYTQEINKLKETIEVETSDTEIDKLKARILELQSQLSDVVLKREEISNLQNGKAGNVYIISNLGSFGSDVFKIGMTRRLDPQERVNELGSASVPFKFDVHSFIFSEDAVGLENKLHNRLNNCRLNKVNLRKEFFKISLEELEQLVNEIDPTAEFNRAMIAEEFFQSQTNDVVYTTDFSLGDDEDETE